MTTDRTWLIRTKQNKILGPVSKEKVIELVNSGSLTADDEVCSGNGYWFWVKEKDLVQKYLFDGTPQGYNPIAEADTSLANVGAKPVESEAFEAAAPTTPAASASSSPVSDSEEEPTLFPEDDDLDFPDVEDKPKVEAEAAGNSLFDEILDYKPKPSEPEVEAPSEASSSEGSEDEETIFPDDDDLEFPDLIIPEKKEEVEAPAPAPIPIPSSNEDLSLDLSAPDVPSEAEVEAETEDEGPAILPDDDDLAYPDMGATESEASDIKVEESSDNNDDLVIDLGSDEPEESNEEVKEEVKQEPSSDDLDINSILNEEKADLPEEPIISEDTEKSVDELLGAADQVQEMPKPKKKKRRRKKKKAGQAKPAPKRNDRMIMYVLILVILGILYGIYFYYTQILGQSLVLRKLDPFFNEAQAQEKIVDVKKKFL